MNRRSFLGVLLVAPALIIFGLNKTRLSRSVGGMRTVYLTRQPGDCAYDCKPDAEGAFPVIAEPCPPMIGEIFTANKEWITLPNGRRVCRANGCPVAAYYFEGDGNGELLPSGRRYYRFCIRGGGWVG